MHRVLRRAAPVAAATAALIGTTAATASAGDGPAAPYNGACGEGHYTVNHRDLGDAGTIYLTYNAATGYNCAVTVSATPGERTFMKVWLERTDGHGTHNEDFGEYAYYAGPVFQYAPGRCVSWGGTIGTLHTSLHGTNCG